MPAHAARTAMLTAACATCAPLASATLVEVQFSGTIDSLDGDPAFVGADIGDEVFGSFVFDATVPEDGVLSGNFFGAVSDFFVELIDVDQGLALPVVFGGGEIGDIFLNDAEVGWFFGPPPGGLGPNFDLTVVATFPTDPNLQDLADALLEPEGLAFDFGFGTVDNAFTDGNLNFELDNIEASIVPEPASLALVGLAGVAGLPRRRRH